MATIDPTPAQLARIVGKLQRDNKRLIEGFQAVTGHLANIRQNMRVQRSITEEIDAIPGRRIDYDLVATLSFTAADAGTRKTFAPIAISQDGPFIWTHKPVVGWRVNAPTNAFHFGKWRPPYSFPLPVQSINSDTIDISTELFDGGSQREFQNEAAPPILSRADQLIPLPVPTLWAPNSSIKFTVTFENIDFFAGGDGENATTGGKLVVCFPGYRIVNM
jgi:hypothetical protein